MGVDVPESSAGNLQNYDNLLPVETSSKSKDQNVQDNTVSSPVVVSTPISPVKPNISSSCPETVPLRPTKIHKQRLTF